jgi:SET domain-containing protein
VLSKTAHSCEPNCRIDLQERVMIATRAIGPGEAITYDYETTETWFSHPFWCLCGARRCRGRIG